MFEGATVDERVVRVPALEHFRHSDFSFPLPIPSGAHSAVHDFGPDVVHSHHPFLLGDTALRIGSELGIPVVFTHHTQYEKYTHYFTSDETSVARRFINELDIGYCNLCDAVIAPSQTIADDLRSRHVESPVEVIPTGVDLDWWRGGDGDRGREACELPIDAFVVGHVGRLAKEKNVPFLADSIAQFMARRDNAYFIACGVGPYEEEFQAACTKHGVADRLRSFGIVQRSKLRDLYGAMNVFAFASHSETQGIVLAEAMAAGAPVVALDAPGVREIVIDKVSGRLLLNENQSTFVEALNWIADLDDANRAAMKADLVQAVAKYSIKLTAQQSLELYELIAKGRKAIDPSELQTWRTQVNRIEKEFQIWGNLAHATGDAIFRAVRNTIFC